MRYKVRAEDAEQLARLCALAEGRARIYVVSEKRLFLSLGEISDGLMRELVAQGAKISPEHQYSLAKTPLTGT